MILVHRHDPNKGRVGLGEGGGERWGRKDERDSGSLLAMTPELSIYDASVVARVSTHWVLKDNSHISSPTLDKSAWNPAMLTLAGF